MGGKTVPSAETIGKGTRVLDEKAPQAPGRTHEPKVRTGDDYIDRGAVCDGAPESSTCFLEERQRSELIDRLQLDMANAAGNYKLALMASRINTLLKKEPDLSWITNLAIDLISGFMLGALAKCLGQLRERGIAALDDLPDAGTYGPVKQNKKQELFAKLTDARIKDSTKRVLDPQKKAFSSKVQTPDAVSEKKSATLGLIKQVTHQTDKTFQQLSASIPAVANDAELVWLHLAFKDTDAHSQDAYETAVNAKLDRFHALGVADIGRKNAKRRDEWSGNNEDVSRLVRVTMVHFTSGHPPEHWLERWDQSRQYISVNQDFAWQEAAKRGEPTQWKQRKPHTAQPELVERIPDEFLEFALLRQAEVYGKTEIGFRQIDESDHEPWIYGEERYKRAYKKTKASAEPLGNPLGFAPIPAPANAQAPAPAPASAPMIPTQPPQPTSFGGGGDDDEPIKLPKGPLGFGGT